MSRKFLRCMAAAAVLLVAAFPGLLRAQSAAVTADPSADPAALRALVQQMQQMQSEIAALKAQIGELKSAQSTGSGPMAAPASVPPPAAAPAPAAPVAAGDSEPTYPNLNFHGFGDFQYEYSSNKSQFPNQFDVGEIDLYLTSQISENASILSENVISADSTFNNWNVEAERFLFDYKFSPYLNLVAGRFHTEIGYYNTAFHHGTWFQLDTHRPWFLEFEDSGGILPVHMVGVSADGAIESGSANLHYFVQVGNGRSYTPSTSPANPTQADTVSDGHKAVNLALTAKPTWAPGWTFGGGYYHQVVVPQNTVPGVGTGGVDVTLVNLPSVSESIGNAFAVYNANGWSFLNEAFVISHEPTHGTAHRTFAGYSEVGKKFGAWTPYGRFTYVNSPASDPLYTLIQTAGLRYGPTLGLRYDFTDFASLKVQYEHNIMRGEQETAPSDDVIFQVGFTF